MDKTKATKILGGTLTAAAKLIGITPQAYSQWPEKLPRRLEDRVLAALARQGTAKSSELRRAARQKPEPQEDSHGSAIKHWDQVSDRLAAGLAQIPEAPETSDAPSSADPKNTPPETPSP